MLRNMFGIIAVVAYTLAIVGCNASTVSPGGEVVGNRVVVFSDDFSTAKDGKPATDKWDRISGDWFVKDGTLHQNAGSTGYDKCILTKGVHLSCDYRLETKIRLVDGGAGAGFYWNIRDPKTGHNSNMIRCDGKGPAMFGYFNGNLFIPAEQQVEGTQMYDMKWHTMRMDVKNSTGTFDVFWDGKKIADNLKMHHLRGYVGLQVSLGHTEFDDVTISVAKGTDWKSSPKLTTKPKISDVTRNSAVVTWQTSDPTPTKILLLEQPYRPGLFDNVDYSEAIPYGDKAKRKNHTVKLTGLNAGTEYTIAIPDPVVGKPTPGTAVNRRFVTLPPKGKMIYREVPLAILCYENIILDHEKRPEGTKPRVHHFEKGWFEGRIDAGEIMRYFYWTNSFFKLDTKCKYLRIERPTNFSQLGFATETVYNDLVTLAKREGLRPDQFGAVLVQGGNGTYAYPWPTPWWESKLNFSTGACFNGYGDCWILTHEFHHLTEGWVSMIGHPVSGKTGYAHADQPWIHPGRFGENYDYLAHSLRVLSGDVYLKLGVGRLMTTADKDGDGVPDDDPGVIFDENRGNTSPMDMHSYKNGLTDLQNLTAESFTPAVKGHKHPLLTKRINLKYPFAIFSYDYNRKKKTPTIDGKFEKGEWDKFASTPNAVTPNNYVYVRTYGGKLIPGANYKMDTYLNWDDNYLYIAAKAPFRFLISPQLDCNADGYFSGKDNPRLHVSIPRNKNPKLPPNTIHKAVNVMVWNNVEPVPKTGYPGWTNDIFDKKDDIKWAWGKDAKGNYVIELAIPRCDTVSLIPKAGKEMAVRLWCQGYLPPTEKNKYPSYAWGMFDSCEYGYFKLVK